MKEKLEQKYAPKTTKELLFDDEENRLIVSCYSSGEFREHLLLHGPPGTGKTSIANLIAKESGASYSTIAAVTMIKRLEEELDRFNTLQAMLGCFGDGATHAVRIYEEIGACEKNLSRFWLMLDRHQHELTAIFTTNDFTSVPKQIRSRCRLLMIEAVKAQTFLPRAMEILAAEGFDETVAPSSFVLRALQVEERHRDNRRYYRCLSLMMAKLREGFQLPVVDAPTTAQSDVAPQIRRVK